ncbi:MAG: ABC transporter ATP-binding protein [Anaerolineae bacterium]|nr:ABC transporter ATP-binding protein [Anaerolineae bacterium]MDW8099538.1 ABC transporter ATP-binding protein [Anaerolineae bacterium]
MAEVRVEEVYKRFFRQSLLLARKGNGCPLGEEQASDADIVALDGVSLTVRDGEVMSVVGPSGCGKSTLLRVIAGLETPDRGRVLYDGRDMANVPPRDRGIGMVFQNYALYPHFDAYDNLGFFFKLRRREHEIDPKVREAAEILGVDFRHLLSRKPPTLSGGERQRVAVGRCIVRDPKLFLFDEPLSNLDAKLRSDTRVQIKRLLQRFRVTSIYVTHDQTEAIAMGDRIAVMRQGRIVQVGTFRELYDRPIDVFVASFFGTPPMNFLPGRVERGAFIYGSLRVPLPEDLHSRISEGQAVQLGVRPEHWRLTSGEGLAGAIGIVEVVEHLPSARIQYVHLRLEGLDLVAQATQEMPIARGDRLALTPDPGRLYLFDAATGRNLVA